MLSSCERRDRVDERELDEFSVKDNLVIGETIKSQIKKMPEIYPVLDEKKYQKAYTYLNALLQTLKLTSKVKHRNQFDWEVIILHDDRIKTAFTLPGGQIYIYTGLLKFLNAEHELMAVLGNEIAYADKEIISYLLKDEYGGVLLGNITLGKDIPELPEIARELPSLEFSEEMVFDADEFAIQLICPFQYDISGLKGFVQRAYSNNIEWALSKRWENIEVRLSNIEGFSEPCGEGGVTNLEQYQRKIKDFLP